MKLNGNAPELFDKVASLMLHEVSKDQIASVVGCSAQELEELLEMKDYQQVYAEKFYEEIQGQKVRNAGWDEIESQALLHLMEKLPSYAMDAEFMLKVAALANKAQRRNPHQKPISVDSGEKTLVLQLQPTFIQKLQQYNAGDRPAREIPKKDNQILDADKVEEILSFRPGPSVSVPVPVPNLEQEKVGA